MSVPPRCVGKPFAKRGGRSAEAPIAATRLSASKRGPRWNRGSATTSFFTPSGKTGSIFSFTQCSVSSGVMPEMRRALGEDLDEREAPVLDLQLAPPS